MRLSGLRSREWQGRIATLFSPACQTSSEELYKLDKKWKEYVVRERRMLEFSHRFTHESHTPDITSVQSLTDCQNVALPSITVQIVWSRTQCVCLVLLPRFLYQPIALHLQSSSTHL